MLTSGCMSWNHTHGLEHFKVIFPSVIYCSTITVKFSTSEKPINLLYYGHYLLPCFTLNSVLFCICRYILDARELPILSMLERIKGQLMQRHYSKQLESEKMKGNICPKIKKKVEKLTEWANLCYVEGAGDGVF